MTKRIAIVGGGIAGVTAAWQLARLAAERADIEAVLFEASTRLGGIVETVREAGFTIECGPDAWVTEKPWARELVEELGLGDEILYSNDATRKTYVLTDGRLTAMPDGMRMMVPADLDAMDRSELFSVEAKAAYRAEVGRAAELKAAAPEQDESVAAFVERHFGAEVLEKVGAPLLGGVFGGDVTKLSVRAVMAPLVAMEREHGSLIMALQAKAAREAARPVFTTLRSGMGTLIDRMVEQVPPGWLRLGIAVDAIEQDGVGWLIGRSNTWERFDELILAAPPDVSRKLLARSDSRAAELMKLEASSAVVVALGFQEAVAVPKGFGFLVPPGSKENSLLAATFVDQKFESRVPPGSSSGTRLIRGFFGGKTADELLDASDEAILRIARRDLEAILGKLPNAALSVVRRWPRALPQYDVGHLERMAELQERTTALSSLRLLGNGYRGVGLPDLIRDARAAAREITGIT